MVSRYGVQPLERRPSSAESAARVLLLFIDGIGLAAKAPANPFSTVAMPTLESLLGGPLTVETVEPATALPDPRVVEVDGQTLSVLATGIDANLGVDGLPQSATGQTTLFTGVNAARVMGRHVTAFPGPRLREVLEQHSIFLQLARAGKKSTFANLFSDLYFERLRARRLRMSASVLAVRAGSLRLRDLNDLRRDRAVTWDIKRCYVQPSEREAEAFGTFGAITSRLAGRHLNRLAQDHHFTLWETFATDLAGHGRGSIAVPELLADIDCLIAGVLAEGMSELTVVITSDHGNLEDLSHGKHTRNCVPLIAIGKDANAFAEVRSLTDVTAAILRVLYESNVRAREQGTT